MERSRTLTVLPSVRALLQPELRVWFGLAFLAGAFLGLIRQLPLPLTGLLAFVLGILAWMMLYRIASEALLLQARDGAETGGSLTLASDGLAARHIALWLLATLLLTAFTAYFGTAGLVIGCLVLSGWLPAPTVLVTLSNRLTEALWPPRWARLIRRLGLGDYLRLSGTLLAAGGVYLGTDWLLGRFSAGPALRDTVGFGVWAGAVLSWFHLAGRAVQLHREELGLEVVAAPPARRPERFTRDPERLWSEITRSGGSPEMHAELIRSLEKRGDHRRLLEHARLHIPALLLAFEDPGEALRRAHRMLSLDRDFVLPETEAMFALVRAAAAGGPARLVLRLSGNYQRAFPKSVKNDEVRLLACEAQVAADTAVAPEALQWFGQLMTAKLDADQQARLRSIAPAYLDRFNAASPAKRTRDDPAR